MEAVCSSRAVALALCFASACSFDTSPLGAPAEIDSAEAPASGASTRNPMFDNTGASVAPIAGSTGASAPLVTPPRSDAALPPAVPGDPLVAGDASASANDPADAAAPAVDRDPSTSDPLSNDGSADPPDAGSTGPTTPAPGAPFSPCAQSGDCTEPLVCTTTLTAAGGLGTSTLGYCTAPCPWITGSTGECPQPSSGTIRASCESGIPLCLLDSCERAECPPGLRCLDSETPIGTGQSLHAYACQP
jgi:hypothetical protein